MLDNILGPDAVEWLGVHYKTILDEPGLAIVDSVSPPDSGPPRHVHRDADETFVVLSGECEIWIEGESRIIGPGEAAMVARGREHTFRVVGKAPCRHLVILSPGGFQGFFYEMAAGQYAIPDDMEKVVAIGQKYQLDFTGPPLGAE